jgi:hypothetical protein
MEQKVKLQFSSDLEDVTRISSFTLEDAISNISLLQELVLDIKKNLSRIDISSEEDRETLKVLLSRFDSARVLLSKIDMRLGDVSSVTSGLKSIFEPRQEEEKEAKDDNLNAG